ncbi:GntR family transcriptional regulator [Gordonia sp. TBRC 11910]|uniref:GntR family transcriptional regulator n=1 Tax=Gordonia asplenii TaxID=2725283 RepID=A0A848KUN5_9ACTN|nr:GntR family transcriptional regulator [Gordonia asplenii]NMO01982.1 GntR family transcriptional regulator [Gordonia asplenii]
MPVRVDSTLDNLTIPEFVNRRELSSDVHRHLRRLINDGVIPAGSELNQADLARRFQVSRIPMREAFRMLQQEGLINVELNQRATVRALDSREVDQLYGVRIALEALGVRITAGYLTKAEIDESRECLKRMSETKRSQDMSEWISVHRHFHTLCTARADEPLARIILSYSERTERYLRFVQQSHPDAFAAAEDEHERILAALTSGDADGGSALMARHLAHTATSVLADLDDEFDATTVQQALSMTCLAAR